MSVPISRTRQQASLALIIILLGVTIGFSDAHRDSCHQRHSCPSDGHTYVCGDRGRCEQCPDNPYCLAGQPRPTSSTSPAPTQPSPMPSATGVPAAVTMCCPPGEDCTALIVKLPGEAKTSLLVQAYSFTSAPIAKALLEAHKRGVRVEVLLDKSNRTDKYSAADFVANAGISTKIDARHAIAHNKLIIIDGETVIGGSFNYTRAAQETNAEHVEITRAQAVAARCTANWQAHAQHRQPYVGRGVRQGRR